MRNTVTETIKDLRLEKGYAIREMRSAGRKPGAATLSSGTSKSYRRQHPRSGVPSMPEVPHTGKDHRHIVPVCCLDHISIPD